MLTNKNVNLSCQYRRRNSIIKKSSSTNVVNNITTKGVVSCVILSNTTLLIRKVKDHIKGVTLLRSNKNRNLNRVQHRLYPLIRQNLLIRHSTIKEDRRNRSSQNKQDSHNPVIHHILQVHINNTHNRQCYRHTDNGSNNGGNN